MPIERGNKMKISFESLIKTIDDNDYSLSKREQSIVVGALYLYRVKEKLTKLQALQATELVIRELIKSGKLDLSVNLSKFLDELKLVINGLGINDVIANPTKYNPIDSL